LGAGCDGVDASFSLVTNTTTLADQNRREGVHPITVSVASRHLHWISAPRNPLDLDACVATHSQISEIAELEIKTPARGRGFCIDPVRRLLRFAPPHQADTSKAYAEQ